MTREEIALLLNNSSIPSMMNIVQRTLMMSALTRIAQVEEPKRSVKEQDFLMLQHLGPAAASSLVDQSIVYAKKTGILSNATTSRLTDNYHHNLDMVYNSDEGFDNFSNVLRQFLLPRSAYLDFDSIVDPRHRVDFECGYPRFITPIMYRYMYDRDDVARRVVDIYANESWVHDFRVFDDDSEEVNTPFEEDFQNICTDHNLIQMLYRIDKLSGIGHYGCILIGLDDGMPLDQPIDEPELLLGMKRSVGKKKRNITYLRPFDEYLSFIQQFDTDENSPRYGLPVYYNLILLDMSVSAAGASIGARVNKRVHWTRVIHIADNLASGNVLGIPRQQPVFSRLLDLRKVKGSSGEMFWKAGFPGVTFEIDPRLVLDDPTFDEEKFKTEVRNFSEGMQKYLTLVGIKATSLAPNISEHPENHVRIHLEAIANALDMPCRVFLGTEEGKLGSNQDILTWNKRLKRRNRMFVEPFIIRQTIDRFVAIGAMRPPKDGKYKIAGQDLNNATDEDKANLALKWTQALSQYVTTGMIHFIGPLDYMTMFLGMSPEDALKVDEEISKNGGYEKLKKVDPSQAAGGDGKSPNNANKDQNKDSTKQADKADKQATGATSK